MKNMAHDATDLIYLEVNKKYISMKHVEKKTYEQQWHPSNISLHYHIYNAQYILSS